MCSRHPLDSHANTDLVVQWKVVDAASGEGEPSDKVHEIVYAPVSFKTDMFKHFGFHMARNENEKKRWLLFSHCSTVLLTNYHNKYHTMESLLSDCHTIRFWYHYIPTTRRAKQAEMDNEEQVPAPLRKNKVVTDDTIVQIETLINLKARYDFTLRNYKRAWHAVHPRHVLDTS